MRNAVRPSASRAVDLGAIATLGIFLFLGIALLLGWLSHSSGTPSRLQGGLSIAANVCVVICFVPFSSAAIWFYIRAMILVKREEANGYSTGAYNSGRVRVIDARTGVILREPDDPPLTDRKDLAAARRRALAKDRLKRPE